MSSCPRCHQSISNQEITCPHCGMILKAYGHPGITLHQAVEQEYLCQTCLYHADDTCTFPQRPYAKECTLYTDKDQSTLKPEPIYMPRRSPLQAAKLWCQRHPAVVGLLGLLGVSIVFTLLSNS